MKNKIVTLLTLFMLTGVMLVGCGGTETGADNGGTNTEVGTNSEETEKVDMSIYTEGATYYKITDKENYDYSLVDGEELQDAYWEEVNQVVKIKDSLDIHNYRKEKFGFTKENIECVYYKINGDWSVIYLSTDFTEGRAFVKTDELKASMEVIGTSEGPNFNNASNDTKTDEMSEEAIEILDKIRQGVADENARKAAYLEENSIQGSYNTETLEAESPEGLELYAPVVLNIGDEEAIANMVKTITLGNNGNYTQYYLEYVDTTDTYVEFNLYLK